MVDGPLVDAGDRGKAEHHAISLGKVGILIDHGMVGQWCCMQWSTTKVPTNRIANYTIQPEGVCPVSAIIFRTTRGKTICSDPDNGWTERAMKKVDEEKKKLQQNEDESTSDITPAASTMSKGRKGRKRQRQRSGRGKKRQNKRV
ncbi:C-C motif chemokine 24 CK-beta-6 [Collichthys lucidus]|uniref:C-C motif chemokine 24 CK-beta-6 n=1 Tax=Collichthys lucidus TaxID=240159 RepID=A0A4U5UXE2_COLLU|nr:C-C motif chemokine 24 CK-beta-6 [Collichthys lucidus]